MGKSKKHHSKPHRDSDKVLRDMQNVAKFKRTGWATSWQDMTTMIDYIIYFKHRCRADWINRFHSLTDSYWYQYECGNMTFKDLQDLVMSYSGVRITYDLLSKEQVKRLSTTDKYCQMVGLKNLERNNEIIELHAIHECCALCALHDMGWKDKTIQLFSDRLHELIREMYLGNGQAVRAGFIALKTKMESLGFVYEKIVDWYEEEKK